MRKMAMGTTLACAAVALTVFAPGASAAEPGKGWYKKCFGADGATLEEMESTRCIKVEGGDWQPVGGTDVTADPQETAFGGFVLLAVLLGLAPAFAGAAVASSAKVPPAAGFFTGLFGSWLGVIALYLYGNWQGRSPSVIQTGPAVERSGPAVERSGSGPETSTAADRLRTLQELRDQGLITQDEYQARRQAAVESL